MSGKAERYTVWLADFPFEEILERKIRPVLILDDGRSFLMTLKMTSRPPQNTYDFQLTEWAAAGLAKPTVVCTEKIQKLPHDALIKRIGKLHDNDIALLRVRYSLP